MKKLFAIILLMSSVINGFTQNQYDFSSVCETGQTLFYRITDGETHTVILTHPCSDNDPGFEGDYYGYHPHPEGDIIIPSQVTHNDIDFLVTAIDSRSFWDCLITSVFIPNSVNNIVPGAFSSCEFLESISMDEENLTYYSENNTIIRREDNALVVGCKTSTIPEGIEIICQQAFFSMGNNGVLTIPNSVRIIEECAFAGNHFSGSLTLPESLETIGSMAFYVGGFSGSLTMPNSVTEIGHHAFFGCRFSGSLTLSSSLSKITNCAFADCHFSGTLVIPNSVNLIVSAAFYGNNFSELVLGESVTTIKSNAFADCNNLTGALKLPASLTQIDQVAFKNTSFNEIYSPNRIPPTLASNAFQGYDANIPIYIPFGCTEVYQNAEGWNYFTNFIEEEPILYTDFDPDPYLHIVNSHEELCFDLDGDSISDVCFAYDLGSAWVYFHVTSTQDNLTLCYGLEEGDIIAHAEEWSSSWTFYSSPDDASHMGFRIEKYRNYYYGWLSTYGAPAPEQKWYFDKFAYCTIPNYPLEWGQTTITEGMEENPIENQFLVYPNPANSVLFVETFQETSLPNQTYRIINMMGQTLLHGNITAKTQQIIIENLPAGLYFISVGNVTQKFVVK